MANNKGLAKAKDNKKDEFYTVYETIQEELNHYALGERRITTRYE